MRSHHDYFDKMIPLIHIFGNTQADTNSTNRKKKSTP